MDFFKTSLTILGHLHELGSDEGPESSQRPNDCSLLGHGAYTLATTLRGGMLRVRSVLLVRRRRSLTSHVYRIAKDYFLLLMESISASSAEGSLFLSLVIACLADCPTTAAVRFASIRPPLSIHLLRVQ